jgi:hypothetical protein
MEENLLNCVGDIHACECEILKSTCQTHVICSIINKITISSRELQLSINQCQISKALGHADALKEVNNILLLGEEQAVRRSAQCNAEEEVKLAKITHRKFIV